MPLAEATALAGLRMGEDGSPGEPLHLEMADPLADRVALEELAAVVPAIQSHRWAWKRRRAREPVARRYRPGAVGRRRARRWPRQVVARFTPAACTSAWPSPTRWEPPGAWLTWPSCQRSEIHDPRAILAALPSRSSCRREKRGRRSAPLAVEALRLPDETCEAVGRVGTAADRAGGGPAARHALGRVSARWCWTSSIGPPARRPRRSWPAAGRRRWEFERLFEHPTGRREMIEWTLDGTDRPRVQALACERLRHVCGCECRFEYEQAATCGEVRRRFVSAQRPSPRSRGGAGAAEARAAAVSPSRWRRFACRCLAIDRLEFRQQEMFFSEHRRRRPRGAARAGRAGRSAEQSPGRAGRDAALAVGRAQPEFACQYKPWPA